MSVPRCTNSPTDNWPKVLDVVHEFVSLFQATPVDLILQSSIFKIARAAFHYGEKEKLIDHGLSISRAMLKSYRGSELVIGPAVYLEFDQSAITAILGRLTPGKAHVNLLSRDVGQPFPLHEEIVHSNDMDHFTDHGFDTACRLYRLVNKTGFLDAKDAVADGLSICKENPFTPSDLTLVERAEPNVCFFVFFDEVLVM